MNTLFKSLSLALILSPLFSFESGAQTATIADFAWLKGHWALQTKKGMIYESWSALDSTTLKGISYRLQGIDTILLETVHLKCSASGSAYIPLVTGQNDGQAVTFQITSVDKNSFIAENPTHDFPKRITYQRTGTQLHAVISGDGKEVKYPFVTHVPTK